MNHIRQGQNNNNSNSKRSRGRGRKPQSGNSGNRAYDSNGPDVKIRGTATHVCEKYQQLARDAITSGDRVMAENYYQHAEHYYRLIMASQAPNDGQPRPQNALGYRPDEDQEYDEDDNGMDDQVQPQSAGQPYHQQNNNQNNNNNQNSGGGEQRRNNNNNNNGNSGDRNRNRNRDRDGYNNQNRNPQNAGGGEQSPLAASDDVAPEHAEQPVIADIIAAPVPQTVSIEADAIDAVVHDDAPRRRAPRRRRPRAEAGAEGGTSETVDAASDE